MHSEDADTPAQSRKLTWVLTKLPRLSQTLLRRKGLLAVGGLALLAAAPLVNGFNPALLTFNLVGLGIGLLIARRVAASHQQSKLNRQWAALNQQILEIRQQELAERQDRLARRRQPQAQQGSQA